MCFFSPLELCQPDFSKSQILNGYPDYPMVRDVSQKADMFDQAVANFTVPPLASATAS